jgi:hypothetical protein
MPTLHYGTEQTFDLDDLTAATVMQSLGAKLASADRAGWVTFTDSRGTSWSLMATPGVAIFINAQLER